MSEEKASFVDFYKEGDKKPAEFLKVGTEVVVIAPEDFLELYHCHHDIIKGNTYKITQVDQHAVEDGWDTGTYELNGLMQGWVKASWVVPAEIN